MTNGIKLILMIAVQICISSCAVKKTTYRGSNLKRIIVLENDSIIRYTEFIGCFGNSNILNYRNENGLLKLSGKPDKKQVGIFSLATDLYDSELKIYTDSLIVKQTGEVFYNDNFLKLKANKQFEEFYIIFNEKKKKITKSNFKRILTNKDLENYSVVEIDKSEAEKKYGINKKYKTLKFVRK